MKVCRECKRELPLADFPPRRGAPDGRRSECRECTRTYNQAYSKANKKRIRVVKKLYEAAHLEAHNESTKAWQKRNRPVHAKINAAWAKRNRDKIDAHRILRNAIRDGKLVKPEVCSVCGRKGRIEGHHADYSKPLEVIWLCSRHHRDAHG